MTRATLTAAAAFLAVSMTAATAAPAAAQDNAAVAINTKDGSSIFRFAFHIHRAMGDVVDNSNAAAAFASCEDCQTVAVAIQVVLIMSDPEVVTPTNLALAINYDCDTCRTLASAYQFVLTTGGPVHFTAEGNQRLAELRRRLLALLNSDATVFEIQAELDLMAQELAGILEQELAEPGSAAAVDPSGDPGATTPDPAGEGATNETGTTPGDAGTVPEDATVAGDGGTEAGTTGGDAGTEGTATTETTTPEDPASEDATESSEDASAESPAPEETESPAPEETESPSPEPSPTP